MRIALRLALVVAVAAGCAVFAAGALTAPGDILWKVTADPTTGMDEFTRCALAPGGGVYVAGVSAAATGADITVARYTNGGTQMWSQTYDEAHSGDVTLGDMAADGLGNVYVCGSVKLPAGTYTDALLLKYGPTGSLLWATVASADLWDDGGVALGIDADGNVCVAGSMETDGMGRAIWTAKFDADTGARVWIDGFLGRYPQGAPDTARDIAVAPDGTCFTAGSSAGEVAPLASTAATDAILLRTEAAGGSSDYKVWDGSAGKDDEWSRVSNAPGGVAVAGTTNRQGNADVAVARYNADLTRRWLRSWTSRGDHADSAEDLAVTGSGAVWVAAGRQSGGGAQGMLIKWSAAGRRLFVRNVAPGAPVSVIHDMAVDSRGNVYVVGSFTTMPSELRLLAAKFSPGGRLLWRRTPLSLGPGSRAELNAVAVGGSGGVYTCGHAATVPMDWRAMVLKFAR